MKSNDETKTGHNMLISRKKPQTTRTVVLSVLGFLMFLTGALLAATAVIDAFLNQVSTNSFIYLIGGIVGYKIGRLIMKKVSE